jgi:hypothetical protein
MLANYNAATRTHIRSNYIPKTDKIEPALSTINKPIQGEKVETYNSVFFDWEDQNAEFYLLEVFNSQQEYYAYFTTSTEFLVTDLKPNKLYLSTVRAFHQGYFDTDTPNRGFRTGTSTTATEETSIFSDLSIIPNPVSQAQEIIVSIDVEKKDNISLTIRELSGKTVSFQKSNIQPGKNILKVATIDLPAGMYLLTINAEKGNYTKKIIVQ